MNGNVKTNPEPKTKRETGIYAAAIVFLLVSIFIAIWAQMTSVLIGPLSLFVSGPCYLVAGLIPFSMIFISKYRPNNDNRTYIIFAITAAAYFLATLTGWSMVDALMSPEYWDTSSDDGELAEHLFSYVYKVPLSFGLLFSLLILIYSTQLLLRIKDDSTSTR